LVCADLEWRVIYVGSAESTEYDQELDSVLVGPVPVGTNKFILQTNAPDASRIPDRDLMGVTVVLITCSYKEQEFIRVGYYVNNSVEGEEGAGEEGAAADDDAGDAEEAADDEAPEGGAAGGGRAPTRPIDPAWIVRNLLADKPRVTRFPIDWS
jgi:histone chaperone ASF1